MQKPNPLTRLKPYTYQKTKPGPWVITVDFADYRKAGTMDRNWWYRTVYGAISRGLVKRLHANGCTVQPQENHDAK